MGHTVKLLVVIACFFVRHQIAVEAVCVNGAMRAVGANITQDPLSGDTVVSARVQLCLLDQWADICFTDVTNRQRWHPVDGDIACKQLRNENSTIVISEPVSPSLYTIGVTGCFGIESRLVECPLLIETNCGSRNALVTNCRVTASKQCTNGNIDIREEEPMKICEDGRWKYLCGQLWSDAQAEVVCRQTRMSTAGARGTKVLSPGGSEILAVHHTCSGREPGLEDCPKSSFFSDVDCTMVAQVYCQGLNDSTTKNINVTSLSPTAARVTWIIQSNASSDSFTITCSSSGHNTVSLSGSLQNTLSDRKHTTTINGLDPGILYRCCVTLIDEGIGSMQLCSDVQQPTLDGATGTFDRNTSHQSCPDNAAITSRTDCSAIISTVILASPVTTTILKTTLQIVTMTIVVAPPQSKQPPALSKSTVASYQTQIRNSAAPSSGAQVNLEPLSWGVGIIIGVVVGVGIMTAILFTVLMIVLLKLRKSASKQLNANNSLLEIRNTTYTSTDVISEKQSDAYEYVATPSARHNRNVYDTVTRESVSSYSDVDDQKGLVPDEYVIMK